MPSRGSGPEKAQCPQIMAICYQPRPIFFHTSWLLGHFYKNHVFKFGFISLIRLSTTHFMIYFCFVLGPTLFWAIMTIFLQKFHFWGLNFTVFESEGPLLPKISQIGSIIVGKNCLPWKVDDFRFLKLPKMLSGLWDMPIFLEV